MQTTFLESYDYDAYRQPPSLIDYPEFSASHGFSIGGKRTKRILTWFLILLAVGIIRYSLCFIPAFAVQSITFHVSGGFSAVPQQAVELANGVLGQSLFSNAPRTLEKALAEIPVVSQANVSRRLFSTLDISLRIEQPQAIIVSRQKESGIDTAYLVKDTALLAIAPKDFSLYRKQRVPVVQISGSYADYLVAYGADNTIKKVLELAAQVDSDAPELANMIKSISYGGASNREFGTMVFSLADYNAQVWVREPVSKERLYDALRLIAWEHQQDQRRNIALHGQLRYDLYMTSFFSVQ